LNSQAGIKFLFILALLSVLLLGGLICFDFVMSHHKLPPNSFVGNINISRMTKKEVIYKLKNSAITELSPSSITLIISSNETFSFFPREFGVYILAEKTADSIFSLPEISNYFLNLRDRFSRDYHVFNLALAILPEKTRDILFEVSQQVDAPAINAKIELEESSGKYHIYPDSPKRKLNIEKTLEIIRKTLARGDKAIKAEIEYSFDQKIKESDLRRSPPVNRISSFTTYFGAHDSPNRIHNIKLIASWLDNTLMMSGEILSLTEKIGDFSPQRGFRQAYVISNNELVPEYGGGTCQIATTLYNTVALADIKVLARRNHSFYFNIYPLGRDATVYPGSADFKFQNDTGYPILIKATATNHKLSFRIYGTPSSKEVVFSGASIYSMGGNGAFKATSYKRVIGSNAPFRTVVKRTVIDKNTKEIITEEIIRSYYKLYGDGANVPIKRRESR